MTVNVEALAALWRMFNVSPQESLREAALRSYEVGEHMAAASEILNLPHDATPEQQWAAIERAHARTVSVRTVALALTGEAAVELQSGARVLFGERCLKCAGKFDVLLCDSLLEADPRRLLEAGIVAFELRCRAHCQAQSPKSTIHT